MKAKAMINLGVFTPIQDETNSSYLDLKSRVNSRHFLLFAELKEIIARRLRGILAI